MQLLPVWAVLAAAICPGWVSSAELSCDCRLSHMRDMSVALHCSRDENGASEVNCQKAKVLELPHGYQYIPGYALIKLYRTMKTWAAAKKTCEGEGAQLAVPPDSNAYNGIKQLFSRVKGVWWAYLGISDQAKEGEFVGMDGRPVSYLPWKQNEPNNFGGNENCVDVNGQGLLNDAKCSNTAPFFCERRLSVSVPDGYAWVQDAGRFYKVHAEKRVHAQAAAACRSENARLAVTDTWRRGEALVGLFDLRRHRDQFYFIGFTDEATEGDFVTETGRHLRDMEFQVWVDNEPNNIDDGRPENCLVLSDRGYYNDVRCDREFPFICEILPL